MALTDEKISDLTEIQAIDGNDVLAIVDLDEPDVNDRTKKIKFSNIQLNSNWNEADPASKAYIQNKPTLVNGLWVIDGTDLKPIGAQDGIVLENSGEQTSLDVLNGLIMDNGEAGISIGNVDMISSIWSPTGISGLGITLNGAAGTVDIASGKAAVRIADTSSAQIVIVDIPAFSGLAVPVDTTYYIYVEWNSGTPRTWYTADFSAISSNDKAFIHVVTRQSTEDEFGHVSINKQNISYMHKANVDSALRLGVPKLTGFDFQTNASWNIITGQGTFSLLNTPILVPAFDTSGADTFKSMYSDGAAGWTRNVGQTAIDYNHYDDGDGTLGTVANNKYSVHWLFIEYDSPSRISVLYGTQEHATITGAKEEALPSVRPSEIVFGSTGVEQYKIIFKGDGTFIEAIDLKVDATGAASTGASTLWKTSTNLSGQTILEPISDPDTMALGGAIADPTSAKLVISVSNAIGTELTVSNSLNGTFDGLYVDTGSTGSYGLPIFQRSADAAFIIRDSTNSYWTIDNQGVSNPVFNTAEYVNFTGSQSGLFTGVGGNTGTDATVVQGAGGSADTSINSNGIIKSPTFISQDMVGWGWNDTHGHNDWNLVESATGASYVWNTNGVPRFAIPVQGAGNATQMYRSVLIGGNTVGDANLDIDIDNITDFDKTYIPCDTDVTGADLGVGGKAQILGGALIGANLATGLQITPSNIYVAGTSVISKWNTNSSDTLSIKGSETIVDAAIFKGILLKDTGTARVEHSFSNIVLQVDTGKKFNVYEQALQYEHDTYGNTLLVDLQNSLLSWTGDILLPTGSAYYVNGVDIASKWSTDGTILSPLGSETKINLTGTAVGIFNGSHRLISSKFNTIYGNGFLLGAGNDTVTSGLNIGIGVGAVAGLTTAYYCTAIGDGAGNKQSSGGAITAIGYYALAGSIDGATTVSIGGSSGRWFGATGTTVTEECTTPVECLFMGQNTRPKTVNPTRENIIGAYGFGMGDNTTVIGANDNTATFLTGGLFLKEQALASTHIAGYGQQWQSSVDDHLHFKSDSVTDAILSAWEKDGTGIQYNGGRTTIAGVFGTQLRIARDTDPTNQYLEISAGGNNTEYISTYSVGGGAFPPHTFKSYDGTTMRTLVQMLGDGSVKMPEVYSDTVTSSKILSIQSDGQIGVDNSNNYKYATLTMDSPVATDQGVVFRTCRAITITKIWVANREASKDLDALFVFKSDLAGAGTSISAVTTINSSSGVSVSPAVDPTVPVNNWVVCQIDSVTTAPSDITIHIEYTED